MNIERMQKLLDHVTAHPEEHDQNTWGQKTACGTTMCLAGHAVEMFGAGIAWMPLDPYSRDPDTVQAVAIFDKTGREIPEAAAELLDLTLDEMTHLFYTAQTADDLWKTASVYTRGKLELPLHLR